MNKRIGVIVGSLRAGSYNNSVAKAICCRLPDGLEPEFLAIGDLPLYNEDLDEGAPPAAWVAFRERLAQQDAFLFLTPEYNRSMPAAIKNALDIGSRPYGSNLWAGKPAAVISVSIGAIGGFGANHALRQSLVFLDVYPMQQPEAYIGGAADVIGTDGTITDDGTCQFLQTIADAFAKWVLHFYGNTHGEGALETKQTSSLSEEGICSPEFSVGCRDATPM